MRACKVKILNGSNDTLTLQIHFIIRIDQATPELLGQPHLKPAMNTYTEYLHIRSTNDIHFTTFINLGNENRAKYKLQNVFIKHCIFSEGTDAISSVLLICFHDL